MNKIKLMTDYGCSPIWDCIHSGEVDLMTLNLSDDLLSEIGGWAKWYDSTLNEHDPKSSGFSNNEELMKFDQEGHRLWLRLKNELSGKYIVCYYSTAQEKLLE